VNDLELQLVVDQTLDLCLDLQACVERITTIAHVLGLVHDTLDELATQAYAERQDDLLTREGAI
jgi:hypothetical protein